MRSRPLASLTLALVLVPALASSQSPDGVYRRAGVTARPGSRTTPITHGRRAGAHARLGRRIRPRRAVVYATDNTNRRHHVDVRHRPPCGDGVLRLGADAVISESRGGDSQGCSLGFTLDSVLAARAASVLGVPRQDRRPIGARVRGAFRAPSRVPAGAPVTIELVLENPSGASAVQHQVGGRNRGPRNNRFDFAVRRDGRPVARADAFDLGGITGFVELAPGERYTVSAELGRWADVTVPGRYVVECAFETDFAPVGIRPFEHAHLGDRWTRTFRGTVRFEVR
ncbi:MAG TPA: hypothetical protein RMH99_27200 [Sandaracinaceae bacterium LLY-WYZ-13_1]|nr:hypothetical protein [Sandaracinaceae bacterium LLY-WYZ-13_1]